LTGGASFGFSPEVPPHCPNPTCNAVIESEAARFCARCGAVLPVPSVPVDPLVGQRIADGRYVIESLLGEGGMGKVYLATQRLGNVTRKVAVKVLHPEARRTPGLVDRLQREVTLAIQLDHPNIVRVYDSGALPDGALFVVLEYVEGVSLTQTLTAGPLAPARAEVVVRQVASALAHAHEHGIVHRDLKPDNVLLTRRGARGDVVKVVDFGIARQVSGDAGTSTRAGLILGTPPYMAPEQFVQSDVTASADLYALGVLVYEMLTGSLPYRAATPWEWAVAHGTGTPAPLTANGPIAGLLNRHADAVMRALGRTPRDRFASVIEFAQAFTGDPNAGAGWTEGFSSVHGPSFVPPDASATPSVPPTTAFPSQPPMVSIAYAPTLQRFAPEPTPPGAAPPNAPAASTRTVLWVVLAAVIAALLATVVAVVVVERLHPHPSDPHHDTPSPLPADVAPNTPPLPVDQGADAHLPRPPAVARDTFSDAHRYWTPGGNMPPHALAAVVAPAVARRDGQCLSVVPGGVVTLLLPAGRTLTRRPGADLRVTLAGTAPSGTYSIALGPDHDHLQPAFEHLRGDVEIDVDLWQGSNVALTCVRVSTSAPGVGICLDAVDVLQ
jgi:serine/threonine protein kinase